MRNTWNQLRASTGMLALTLASASYSVVDQAFAARLSSGHLYALSLLTGLSVIFAVAARVLGQAIIVSKDGEDFRRPTVQAFSALAPIALLLGFLFSAHADLLDVATVSGFSTASGISGLGAWLVGFSLLLKYQFIGTGKIIPALLADVLGNIINIAGNAYSLSFGDPGSAFIGFTISTVACQTGACIALWALSDRFEKSTLQKFWSSMRSVLSAEALIALLQAAMPTLIIYLSGVFFSKMVGATVSIGLTVAFFIERPFTANLITTIRTLAAEKVLTLLPAHLQASKQVTYLWLIATGATIFVLPVILRAAFNVTEPREILMVMIIVSGFIIRAAAGPCVAALKANRDHASVSRLEWLAGDIAVVLIMIVGAHVFPSTGYYHSLVVVGVAVLLPAIFWTAAVSVTASKNVRWMAGPSMQKIFPAA